MMAAATISSAQSTTSDVLRQIESNNPSLKASASEAEAQKLANRESVLLENPEVEFNYLWGNNGIGNRRDIRVSQGFDIPTITGMKSKHLDGLNDLTAIKYKADRMDVLLEAKHDLIDLVYLNALCQELNTHLEQTKSQVESLQKRIAAGRATILDLNNAKVHMTTIQGKLNNAEFERQNMLSSLKRLNGGNDISFDATSYDISETLPADFDTWFQEASSKNPVLEYARKQVDVQKSELSISKAEWMPELKVGYMGELCTVEKYRGVTMGVSIPLWSNANKVRRNKAQVIAAQDRKNEAENEFYYSLLYNYNHAASLKANSEMMKASLVDTDNREFLVAAQSKGEISMVDYIVEIDMYFEALEQSLDAERDYRHALATLNAYEL